MAGYTKLFNRILDSTIWRENNPTRLLWITMLALSDQDGIVHCTIPGLADRARISLDECEYALQRFQQPDKYSWSTEKDGRRIEIVEGGWFIINHAKFRALMSIEEKREKTRLRVARWRERNVKSSHSVTRVTVNRSNDIAEAYTDTDIKSRKDLKGGGEKSPPSPKFSQTDFDQRDWRKISAAKEKINGKLKANIGGEGITDAEFYAWVAEESGVTIQRVMELQKTATGAK